MKDDKLKDQEDEELEKGSESELVRSLLEDESKGLGDLESAIENCKDPQLKEILEAIQEDEQKHNAALEQWMQENDSEGLDEHEADESPAEEAGEDDEEIEASADEEPDEEPLPNEEETEKDLDPKGDLIDDIREILAQHETEKADEPEEEAGEEDKDEDLPDFLKEDTEKRCHKSIQAAFVAKAADQQIVYGVVSEPNTIDLQGDRLSESEIRKACHKFMLTSQKIGKEHEGIAKADIIESYIAPVTFKCGGQAVRKGSWVMAVKIHDPDLWQAVKKGDITGFSIAGTGERSQF